MRKPLVVDITAAFQELNNSVVDGVPGVWVVHSKQPGPVVGITMLTHGNEPSGLATYHYFRHLYQLEHRLKRGSVYFVLNNPEAAKRYFTAVAIADENAKRRARFVDVNMNRLPDDPFSGDNDQRYEVKRARVLRGIWARFQYALDIHSTIQTTRPMIIKLARSDMKMISRFPISTVISNIDAVQSGKPACYFYGGQRSQVYGIETGGHEVKRSLQRAVMCTRTFLALLNLIPVNRLPGLKDQVEYRVFDSIWFPDASYELTRALKDFGVIHKGQLLARGDGQSLTAGTDCCALMVPRRKKATNIDEEVFFLTRMPRHLKRKK
ncbi:MAG TPA: succinylglutamate desuccinylase/aspartoacylase family protein [Candidatus Paceibacterota bacterium]